MLRGRHVIRLDGRSLGRKCSLWSLRKSSSNLRDNVERDVRLAYADRWHYL